MGVFQGVSSLLQVEAFCDVDAKKIARGQYIFEDSTVCEGVCTLVVYLDSYATGLISLVFLSSHLFVLTGGTQAKGSYRALQQG